MNVEIHGGLVSIGKGTVAALKEILLNNRNTGETGTDGLLGLDLGLN